MKFQSYITFDELSIDFLDQMCGIFLTFNSKDGGVKGVNFIKQETWIDQ